MEGEDRSYAGYDDDDDDDDDDYDDDDCDDDDDDVYGGWFEGQSILIPAD